MGSTSCVRRRVYMMNNELRRSPDAAESQVIRTRLRPRDIFVRDMHAALISVRVKHREWMVAPDARLSHASSKKPCSQTNFAL